MRTQKNRSPSYPVLSLKEAVEHVQLLFERDRFHDVSYNEVAQRWGYSPSSSNMQRLVAGLKQFGLVEEVKHVNGRSIRLSYLGKRIALGSHSASEDYYAALKEALLNPSVYKKIWAKWQGDLPADEEITRYLVFELDFNPLSVDSFLNKYRDSIRFARQHSERKKAPGIDVEQIRKNDRHLEKELARREASLVSEMKGSPAESEKRVLNIPLTLLGGGQATLSLTIPISEQDFTMLVSLIEANLRVMKPAIVSSSGHIGDVSE